MTTAALRAGRALREARTSACLVQLLDLLGRRGTLRVVWELRDGHPQSFRLLRSSADGISPSVLNARLKELREAGLVQLTPGGYMLTPLGSRLAGYFRPLGRWSRNWAAATVRFSPPDRPPAP